MTERKGELKDIEEIKSIPRATLYEMIRAARNPRDGRLMAAFFLLANRCSEGLAVGPDDVHREVSVEILDGELSEMADQLGRLRTEVDVGRSLGRDVSGAQEQLGKLFDEYQEMNEFKKRFHTPGESLEAVEEIARRYPQTLVYVVKLLTLKRKKRVPRNIPIPVIDPLAPLFVDAVHKMEDRLFPISRKRTWVIFTRAGIYDFYKAKGEMVPKSPLRHARLSELSNHLNPLQVNRFAGWKIRGTGDHYLHMRWSDYVPALVKVARAAPPL
ncbi:hypothetical protein ES703_108057 [subsurface metagenome]